MSRTINHRTFETQVAADRIEEIVAVGHGPLWSLVIQDKQRQWHLLVDDAANPRIWSTLDGLTADLAEYGIDRFDVYLGSCRAGRETRNDEAIRQAQKAAEYDCWFRNQVAEALVEADNPNTPWLTTDEARDELEKHFEKIYGARPKR